MSTRLEEMKGRLEAAIAEARSKIGSADKDEYAKSMAKVQDLRGQLDAETELRKAEDSVANVPAPPQAPESSGIVAASGWGEVRKQLVAMAKGERRNGSLNLGHAEIRAITANGAGVNTAPGVVKALVDGGRLRSKVSVFTGANSQTVVPVFAPHMAVPVGTAPGATGTSSDSTAVLTGDSMTLKAWYSTLAVSMGALLSTDIESYLPGIFQEAFGAAIDKAICVGAGSGSDALGVFIASSSGVTTSQDITCTSGAAAAPNWADYMSMALTLLSLSGGPMDSLAIVVHPTVLATALGSTAVGDQPIKQEFLTRGTIMGIPVVVNTYALTTLTAGSYVAVGGYFKHYGLAIAQEILVDQIKTVGSDNVTFQSFMYMQGKPLVGSSFRRLKTAAG